MNGRERTKTKRGIVIKLDIEKAFNTVVDWAFLDSSLKARGFGTLWRKWIKGCLTYTNFFVIINGRP